TDKRIGHDLERERGKRRVVRGGTLHERLFLCGGVQAGNRRYIDWRWQVVDDGVEKRLDAFVLERRTADDDDERCRLLAYGLYHPLAQHSPDFVLCDLLAVQVFLEQRVVVLADLLDQLLAVFLDVRRHFGRDFRNDVVGAHRLVLVGDRLHLDQVDHAPELVLAPNRKLNRNGIAAKLRLDLMERLLEVGAHAVHLVDEADARN